LQVLEAVGHLGLPDAEAELLPFINKNIGVPVAHDGDVELLVDGRGEVGLKVDRDVIVHVAVDDEAGATNKNAASCADRFIALRVDELLVRLEQAVIAKLRVAADLDLLEPAGRRGGDSPERLFSDVLLGLLRWCERGACGARGVDLRNLGLRRLGLRRLGLRRLGLRRLGLFFGRLRRACGEGGEGEQRGGGAAHDE